MWLSKMLIDPFPVFLVKKDQFLRISYVKTAVFSHFLTKAMVSLHSPTLKWIFYDPFSQKISFLDQFGLKHFFCKTPEGSIRSGACFLRTTCTTRPAHAHAPPSHKKPPHRFHGKEVRYDRLIFISLFCPDYDEHWPSSA